eukprot:3216-Heterococcus_DN1.PRE.1
MAAHQDIFKNRGGESPSRQRLSSSYIFDHQLADIVERAMSALLLTFWAALPAAVHTPLHSTETNFRTLKVHVGPELRDPRPCAT